jgi:hypothetical protein
MTWRDGEWVGAMGVTVESTFPLVSDPIGQRPFLRCRYLHRPGALLGELIPLLGALRKVGLLLIRSCDPS